MIDYGERVQEVKDLLKAEFSIDDPQLVEILLAARLDAGTLPYPWLILETNYFSVLTKEAWFALGDGEGPGRPIVLSVYRTSWPRQANVSIEEVLDQRHKARLFVEPEWEKMVLPNYKAYLWKVLQRNCVSVRGKYPRRALVEPRAFEALKQATEKVLDNRFRTVKPRYATVQPPGLLYWTEMVQSIAPGKEDWDSLLRNLCALAGRIGYLFNHDSVSGDWQAVARVMRDTIPYTTSQILLEIERSGRWDRLRDMYPDYIIRKELHRMRSHGIVEPCKGGWRICEAKGRRQDVLDLLSGNVEL